MNVIRYILKACSTWLDVNHSPILSLAPLMIQLHDKLNFQDVNKSYYHILIYMQCIFF